MRRKVPDSTIRGQRGKKVVLMSTRYPLDHPGGVERVGRELSERIGACRGDWRVVPIAAYSARHGAARVPLLGDIVAAAKIAVAVAMTQSDAVVVHGAEYGWAPLLVARLTRRPALVVWHGVRSMEVFPPPRRVAGRLARRVFVQASQVLERVALSACGTVAVSPSVAADIQERFGFEGSVQIIPNGVAPRLDLRPDSSESTTVEDPLRVIWVGTTAYKKGLDLAIAACQAARAAGQNLHLTVVGLATSRLTFSPGSDSTWVSWLGPLQPSEVDSLLGTHDVLLMPTRYEACSMVVLEALAAGLPVIGSGVIGWQVRECGEVVVGESAYAYAEALGRMGDAERRRKMGLLAVQRARDFSWDAAVVKYVGLLNEMLERYNGKGSSRGRRGVESRMQRHWWMRRGSR
ncbi:MAG: glycosyltransferase family 4 protein [Candidatus Dormibacteraeota bacterium]|nr:glycosyltransferase family 4 protein [Candidatus Dormibacteraeota bacterium]